MTPLFHPHHAFDINKQPNLLSKGGVNGRFNNEVKKRAKQGWSMGTGKNGVRMLKGLGHAVLGNFV